MMQLQKVEYAEQRVLTTQQLADGYGTDTDNIKKNLSNNRGRYKEGVHYFYLEGKDLREFKHKVANLHLLKNPDRIPHLYLWTERGAFLHAKSLNTDQAWAVYEELVDTYFRSKSNQLKIPQSLPEALRLAADLAEQNAALSLTNAKQSQIIGELKPKADYVDWILKSPSVVAMTAIAKDYGMAARTMNKLLHDKGIQFKQGDQWFLYRKYQNKGYTHSETVDIIRSDGRPDITMQTKWTQKGRLFLYELLKADGILPMIEREYSA